MFLLFKRVQLHFSSVLCTEFQKGQSFSFDRNPANNAFRDEILSKGLKLGGTLPNGRLVEIVELPESEHPWFLGAQFHPEFKSRPTNPHPLFRDFIGAALKEQK